MNMISKESAEVLLKILAQSSVSPMSQNADQNYRALAQARDELLQISRGTIQDLPSEAESE